MKSFPIHIILCLSLPLFSISCARYSIWQKSALIVGTGGIAGTVILNGNYANAAASVASGVGVGVIGGAASILIDTAEATPSQIDAAEAAGKRFLAALDAAELNKRKRQKRNLIALDVPNAGVKSRGQTVMVYNLEKRELHTTTAYSLRALPRPNELLKVDTSEAEYVGVIPMIPNTPARSVLIPILTPRTEKPRP